MPGRTSQEKQNGKDYSNKSTVVDINPSYGKKLKKLDTLLRFDQSIEERGLSKIQIGEHFYTILNAVGGKKSGKPYELMLKTSINAAIFLETQIDKFKSFIASDKENKELTKKSTASWWPRHILKELRDAKDKRNSLAGATGAWSLITELSGIKETSEDFFDSFKLPEFTVQITEGLKDSNESMLEYLEVFWEQLVIGNMLPAGARFDQCELHSELWADLLASYGAIPTIGSDGKDRTIHLKDPALFLDTEKVEVRFRSDEEMNSIRLIVYTKDDDGNWIHNQGIVKTDGEDWALDVEYEAKFLIASEGFKPGTEIEVSNDFYPAYEVALYLDEFDNNIEDRSDVSLQQDYDGVAKRAPVNRIVIDTVTSDELTVLKEMSIVSPHYAANEDTARNTLRQIGNALKRKYKNARFRRVDVSKPSIIRKDLFPSSEIENLEVSSEIELSKGTIGLLKQARLADKERINNEGLAPVGYAQLVSLVMSSITEQSTYMVVSPEHADLQIGLGPFKPGEISSYLNTVVEETTDYDVWFENILESRSEIKQLKTELINFVDFTRQQIVDSRDSMALAPLLETHTSELSQNSLTFLMRGASDFIKNCSAQVSSVYHDLERDGGGFSFITACSSASKLAVALTSNSAKQKFINIRQRFEKDDIKLLKQGNDEMENKDIEERATKFTDDLLKNQVQIRLILLSTLITLLFSDNYDVYELRGNFKAAMKKALDS